MTEESFEDFLASQLQNLSLDPELYGPYVLPLLQDEQRDDDEWNNVLELLQASSETHTNDYFAFTELRLELERAWRKQQERLQQAQEAEQQVQAAAWQAELAAVRQEAQAKAAAATATTQDNGNSHDTAAAAAKAALLARFGYEDDDADNQAGDAA